MANTLWGLKGLWNVLEHLEKVLEEFLQKLIGFLPNLFGALIIVLLAFICTKLLPKPIAAMLGRTHVDAVATRYIQGVVKGGVWFLGLLMALDKLGIPIGSLLTLLAAVGAAVALAIKDNLANLASGVVLLFTKPFKAGDYITVDGSGGSIKEIKLMFTYLDTVENTLVAIPNTKMMTATIVNYSQYETRRQDFSFSIGYGDDLPRAKAVLLALLEEHPMILQEPVPQVLVKEQGSSSVVLLARVWCKNEDYWNLQFDLIEKAKLLFDAQGITIPYPQMDVHFPEQAAATGEKGMQVLHGDSSGAEEPLR